MITIQELQQKKQHLVDYLEPVLPQKRKKKDLAELEKLNLMIIYLETYASEESLAAQLSKVERLIVLLYRYNKPDRAELKKLRFQRDNIRLLLNK